MSAKVIIVLVIVKAVLGSPLDSCPSEYLRDPAVTNFRRYVQIDTSQERNLPKAVEFWRKQAQALGLVFNVFYPSDLPVVVISVLGNNPSLPSILLNSHMDVVPAIEEDWTYPPFAAYIDENGDIFGRGTQDDKDVAIQYIEAVKRLKRDNVVLNRTLHITLMPDEETGGFKGIKPFIKTQAFKLMNIGFCLDEGLASNDNDLLATYVDRRPWQLEVTFHGAGGHGYSMQDGSAAEQATKFMHLVNEYRNEMKALMKSVHPLDFGNYTSVNVNMLYGGIKPNIIPQYIKLVIDIRLASTSNAVDMEQMVKSWINQSGAGNDTELTYIRRDDVSEKSTLDNSNPYWVAMRDAVSEMGIKILPIVCPATTDMLVLRNLGIPAVGFSAKFRTQSMVHGVNEYLNARTFLRGIDVYYEVLKRLGNVPSF